MEFVAMAVAVFCCGGLASVLRSRLNPVRWANIAGSFLLGIFAVAAWLWPQWPLILAAGFCGGLTTFSTVMLQWAQRIHHSGWRASLAVIALDLLTGLAAAGAGLCCGFGLNALIFPI